ncbi:hypothetical protein [Aliiglaciecola lipolytica]|uniref:Uncharacterized protein n=1 Tax=Aliiglaciecola lipolytica E3 TaxID=1127673 RepID=K6Y7S6_9ALTE|nr:hypothetical protein [Aliiglaciecola lipolytica]GAC12718.1 hypothetical protein GLIP_0063 [Aliiglaciecola lipolytica E3]
MHSNILLIALIIVLSSCSREDSILTDEMQMEARQVVVSYLKNNDLPVEQLTQRQSKNRDVKGFTYLYKGGNRCIEFIVNCYGSSCKEMQKYPFDEHGDKCP